MFSLQSNFLVFTALSGYCIDTDFINPQTMEVKDQRGLYFVGEVLDVTGHLGGFNFQWAWSSGYCAGLDA